MAGGVLQGMDSRQTVGLRHDLGGGILFDSLLAIGQLFDYQLFIGSHCNSRLRNRRILRLPLQRVVYENRVN